MSTAIDAHASGTAIRGKVAIWWFLASEIMLFGGLIASFVISRLGGGAHVDHSHLNVTVAAINTFILLSSSYTMVEAFASADRGARRGMRLFLAFTVLGGLAFLGIKTYEYTGEIRHGFTPWAGAFWSFSSSSPSCTSREATMNGTTMTRGYLIIWGWLLFLMTLSLFASSLPVTRAAIVTLMFVVAAVKAGLVALHFMHLKLEPWLIYAIVVVPVLLVLGLMVALFPDFVLAR